PARFNPSAERRLVGLENGKNGFGLKGLYTVVKEAEKRSGSFRTDATGYCRLQEVDRTTVALLMRLEQLRYVNPRSWVTRWSIEYTSVRVHIFNNTGMNAVIRCPTSPPF